MKHIRIFGLAVLWLLAGAAAQAQTFDPENPPEPSMKYKVTVGVSPAGAGYASGAGKFAKDAQVYISTSANEGFTFKYWTLNGVQYTQATGQSFYYTVGTENADFVAVYEYDPQAPAEPVSSPTYRLYLDSQPAGACSFNRTSGAKVETGTSVSLSATPSQSFDFLGWYESNTKVSSDISFGYLMTAADHHLTARFEYNPVDPFEPTGSGEGVDQGLVKPGDVNGDGVVNEVDAQIILDVSVGVVRVEDLPNPQTIHVPGGNDNAYEVNAQLVLDYSVTSVKPW